MSSKKVVVDEICTFIFLHKFHPKELQLGDFKKPLKSTTFIQKTYHLDKVIQFIFCTKFIQKKQSCRNPKKKTPFKHKFHPKRAIVGGRNKTPQKAQISSKRGIKRTPRKHLFFWMKYTHFIFYTNFIQKRNEESP